MTITHDPPGTSEPAPPNTLATTSDVVRALAGLVTAALGVVLLLNAPSSVQVVIALSGAGLVVAGVPLLLGRGIPGGDSAPDVATWPRWLDRAAGGVLVALGVTVVAWRVASVRVLAALLAAGLVVSGVTAIVRAVRGSRDDRVAGGLLGGASVAIGLFVLVWPKLSLFLVGLLIGAWLVLTGLTLVIRTVRGGRRRGPAPGTADGGARRRRLRRWAHTAGGALALLVAVALLGATALLYRGDPRIAPDAFYTPPQSVPEEPGRLIRSEQMTDVVPDGMQAWRILYTTTDGAGEPQVASGTVLAAEALPDGPRPVLSVAHGTVGIVPRCAPSLSASPFPDDAAAPQAQMVAEGWVVVASDYVGLGTAGPHAYLVGPDAAHNVLDAQRAADELDGVDLSARTVVWGHSQGGHSALWTGIVAPDYAPEIELLGVAALAPASDLHALAEGVKATTMGKVISAYIAKSWADYYPQLELTAMVTPGYGPIVRLIGNRCAATVGDALAGIATATQLSQEIFRPDQIDGEAGQLLRVNSPTGMIAAPVLIGQGTADGLVLPAQQRDFVAARCAAGQAIDFREYSGLSHLSLVETDSPLTAELLAWTNARLAGEAPTPTC
ncbi:alpha/beta hydrolase [Antribacter sp. KLBMP9083]|uniref:Alpha/beta hydrolase n=1 Tax=Antribacter soli TaxID=2910976 RepID=A0AA41QDF0_9MICO|nr:lipase family protein [Antribacter soli]MCF4121405.1 alpha/beta hydrolase [Antribacter soli]